MKKIFLFSLLLISSYTVQAQSNNLRGTIIGLRNPASPLVRPDTVGVARFKYYDFSAQQLYNWNDSTETWTAVNTVLPIDLGSFRQNGQYLRGYKIYKATISQAGGAAPTATVLENTIGAATWSRVTDGVYSLTLSGAFTNNKTFIKSQSPKIGSVISYRNDANTVYIESGGVDSILDQYSLEIEVYY